MKVGEKYSGSLKFTPTEAKLYDLSFEVQDINGSVDQKIDNNLGDQKLVGVSKEISRKMIAEEGTGTWCTWCPRGAVFMKLMASTYANDFVGIAVPVSYTHLRAHETVLDLVCRLLLEKKKTKTS